MATLTHDGDGARRLAKAARLLAWLGAAGLLLSPLAAMQLGVSGVNWTLSDFAVAGVMLTMAAGAFHLVSRPAASLAHLAAAALTVGGGLMIVWAGLAVGFIGAEGDSFDLAYGVVIAIGVLGSALARLKARGMARVTLAMALAQAAIAVAALAMGKHLDPASSLREVIGANGVLVVVFLFAAALFRHAGRRQA